jgi:hypothetical protein
MEVKKMSATITDTPRSIAINGISFFVDEIQTLQSYFPVYDQVTLDKTLIRQTVVFQKALSAGVLVSNRLDFGQTTTLNLSQDGRALLESV